MIRLTVCAAHYIELIDCLRNLLLIDILVLGDHAKVLFIKLTEKKNILIGFEYNNRKINGHFESKLNL